MTNTTYLTDTMQTDIAFLIKDFAFIIRLTNQLVQSLVKIFSDVFYC